MQNKKNEAQAGAHISYKKSMYYSFVSNPCFLCKIVLFKIILPIYFSYPVIDTGMGGGGGGCFAVFTLQPSVVSPGPGPVRVCSFEWGGADGFLTEGSSSGVSHVFVDN